jgi:TolB-like protein/DNA-binding winged helix-turn-helix (wHTH) protein/Tfp pilus assembly protein PilF
MHTGRLQFERFVLDLDRGCLLLGGDEVTLRPKTFGVLRFLAENAGRLVSKEEIFAAVWPDVVVTDDALVQSIGELRRAMSDDGARLIKTIPRRGYRFEATVRDPATDAQAPTQASPAVAKPASARGLKIALAATIAVIVGAGLATAWKLSGFTASPDRPATARPSPGNRATIAVLPLRSEGGDPAQEYFAAGLTQDIIGALGRFPELTVLSWNAVHPYKANPATPARVARELAAQYQVEGGVLRTDERVRVIAQLVDADGRVHWSGRFDERAADLFTLQDRITRDIAGALAIRVTRIEQTRASAKPAESLEAYDYVLRARSLMHRPTRAGTVEARALLRRAIEIDPDSAPAYAALADTYQMAVAMGWAESPAQALARAEEMALKALSLDPSQAGAHVTLGRIHLVHHRHDQADTELQRAIAINPSDAHALAGRGNVLMWRGETRAAVEALEHAQRIDPTLNAMDRIALGLAYYLEARYDRAAEELELNLRDGTGASTTRVILAAAYAQQGRTGDAARVAETVLRSDPAFDPATFGSKLMNPAHVEQLRVGLRKAGLMDVAATHAPPG